MKCFLRLLTATLLINSSAIGLIGCSVPSVGDVWIITDSGDLFDKAFNQQVLEGAEEFTKIFNDNRDAISNLPNNEIWKDKIMKTRWIISRDSNVATLQNNYNLATFVGAKTIILAGFHHLAALTPAIQQQYKKFGVRFILVDAKLANPIDVASLTYSAEQSGFLAGLAGAIWLVANHESYSGNGLKMSTFGGLPADTIVSYMMGYYWGVYYFNQYRNPNINDDLLTMTNTIRNKIGKLPILATDFITNKFNIIFDKIPKQFTGNFESGTKESKAITSQLIDGYKDDIVMPVAGAQTIDLVSAISNSSSNSNAKIIGVDVDQSLQYHYAKDFFITSALKGIHKAVVSWLWYAFNLDYKEHSLPIITASDGEKYFNGSIPQPALGGNDYTGIANNSAIDVIYNNLISDKYWVLAQKVSDAYNKLVADLAVDTNSEKWENAWQKDIDQNVDTYKPQF